MSHWFKISEASSLALHTMAYLAAHPGRLISNRVIARELGVSAAHLSKVLQRLARAGLLESLRGPTGGFRLGRPAGEISLMEVYEAIDGKFQPSSCLLGRPVCRGGKCVLGELGRNLERQTREYLLNTKLSEFEDFMCFEEGN